MRRYSMQLVCFVELASVVSGAQDRENKTTPQPGAEYSGMYNFLREGEFVQLTVEDQGHVTGFVSRFGDSESDRGAFLDHLNRASLTATTSRLRRILFTASGSSSAAQWSGARAT